MDAPKLFRSAGLVSLATLVSRLFGLIREQVFAVLFGAGLAVDAFVTAFRIPNLLRDLFAEGVLSSAFVPVFTEDLTKSGKEAAWKTANIVISTVILVTGIIVLLGILASPTLVKAIAPGFGKIAGKWELTTLLTRIMFPFLLFISLAAVAMGMLNSLHRFSVPAFAPVMLNLGMILSGFFLCPFFSEPMVGMAIGAVLGAIGQFAIQIPALRKEGYRFYFMLDFKDAGLRKVFFLMTPAILGLASTQINIFVATQIASFLAQGSVAYLNYAYRLLFFPLGVFGVAIATVSLPAFSKLIATGDNQGALNSFYSAIRLVFFLSLPSTVFFCVAGEPVVSALYQYGKFNYQDTVNTASALLFYSLGLFAFGAVRVTVSLFYALKDAKTPVKISVIAVSVNIIANLLLMKPLGFRGLALATSISGVLNFLLLLTALNKKMGAIDFRKLRTGFVQCLLASLLMGVMLWVFLRYYQLDLSTASLNQKVVEILLLLGLAGLSYLIFSKLLKVSELDQIFSSFFKRKSQ
ncbi:MAG: murein biosynthesis integral membrane protein MurJ [candidate division Zixibacteria bacterium RBG_16_48_11]|nr:MAG: murein biosynthesis integral membrane protein MurJ [candidate division Zixibacteria bacterium RBG_16_48_11]